MKFSFDGGKSRNTFLLYMIIYATMLLFGLVENIRGVSLPLIKAQYGVDYESQGGLVSLTWFGYVIFCLVASLFLQYFGIKRSILAGYLAVMLGALATMAAPTFCRGYPGLAVRARPADPPALRRNCTTGTG
jgi:fucose permease